ncbi:DnaJ C-terminal domain-containing protein [Acidiphilium acidophilum]|uniref:DnaJ C-terminal domain-containing protein n=1 Tax=Acidiphilium acidophilum TaxID=76588 RepID=A0AAW9DVL1_ACIAO|nr:DnaJ C-terminal domain-containing protein [Acidiphilium acidophilum]MDX5932067.1 DnaJ C-terminal domain-containing protein [Acidiphilium acidophilum]
MPDPYETLGVARDASAEDIRRAYRKLAKTSHPDLNPGDAAAEGKFKQISAAHHLLSDPDKRARFDRGEIDAEGNEAPPRPRYRDYAQADAGQRYGTGGASTGANWNASDFESIFGTMFNDPGGRPRQGPIRGADAQFTLAVGFLDAVNGTTTRITLPDGGTLDVRIPPATDDGTILRLRGKGGPGHAGGPAGDALIAVHVTPHRFFRRDGQDIRLDLPVTIAEAVLGGPVEVPTPGGPVRMRIPPASDSGAVLRLRGRGVPGRGNTPAGDLYATLSIAIGKPDPALEAFLREWKPATAFNPRAGMEAEP